MLWYFTIVVNLSSWQYSSILQWVPTRGLQVISAALFHHDIPQVHHSDVIMSAISNHRRINCVCNRLFRRRSKLRINGLCEANPPVTNGFPWQRASNAENVCISWSSWKHSTTNHVHVLQGICLRATPKHIDIPQLLSREYEHQTLNVFDMLCGTSVRSIYNVFHITSGPPFTNMV